MRGLPDRIGGLGFLSEFGELTVGLDGLCSVSLWYNLSKSAAGENPGAYMRRRKDLTQDMTYTYGVEGWGSRKICGIVKFS